ncbi:hypothetical protein ABM34_11965 [Companilactobacillus ginsenosidimutans]|uniref:Uncharacterized protein n=1 Tax=Companilactobacillus ginsenosidimutans TaxID=1007676 RepID=A0A0H4QIC0_9LACO|nr:hypothetical protein ABM34_11965 [Companilactobacillus ginsenosidimutans]
MPTKYQVMIQANLKGGIIQCSALKFVLVGELSRLTQRPSFKTFVNFERLEMGPVRSEILTMWLTFEM